jgi:replicative DNA helicase
VEEVAPELPRSEEAERAVLGSILIDGFAFSVVSALLKQDDFFSSSNQWIYHSMEDLAQSSTSIDLVTLKDQLAKSNTLDRAGGYAYIASLVDNIPDVANVEHYARIVKNKSVLRRLIQIGQRLTREGSNPDRAVDEIIGDATGQIFGVALDAIPGGFANLAAVSSDTLEMLEKARGRQGALSGLDTGFRDLNRMTSGLQKGELIILAARPSLGKTSLALNIAQHAAMRSGNTVAFFSLEMSKESLATRVLCSEAEVDSKKVRDGFASDDEYRRLTLAQVKMTAVKFFIDDSAAVSVPQMRARCQRLKRDQGLDLIVVDYLQLMTGHGRLENRTQEVSQISRGLKLVAKDLNVPVLALSQLSRQTERRTGDDKGKPQLSDLRDSGSIEQDADMVMFIYREEMYKPDTDRKNLADITIAKQRNGPVGDFTLVFLKEQTSFRTYDQFAEPQF